jgi:hypothetical protein
MTILFTPSINSTNINKANYYLLFQTIEHKEKETMIYAFGNPGPSFSMFLLSHDSVASHFCDSV